jgi:predicted metalloprotease
MKWEGREESENVEDRRGLGKTAGVAIGGVGGLIVLLLALFLGVDPQKLLDQAGQGQGALPGGQANGQAEKKLDPEEERFAHFARVILHDTEIVWTELFNGMDRQYVKPTMVLFSGEVESACGAADSAVGPFYCPGDSKVYLDLSFFKDMQRRLNAPGEFARAYVIAHEVGHHVQKLLGFSRKVHQARRTMLKTEANKMSVRLELQADYLAGVWAHHGQKQFDFLEKGDLETALNAAFEIGDDRLRQNAGDRVVPDSFTHGTSKQRVRWFGNGFKTGDVRKASQLLELDYKDL